MTKEVGVYSGKLYTTPDIPFTPTTDDNGKFLRIVDGKIDMENYNPSSDDIAYNNTNNNLNAETVQEAIDELVESVDSCYKKSETYTQKEVDEKFSKVQKEINDMKENGTGTTVTGGSVKTILENIMTIMKAQVQINADGTTTPQAYSPDISEIASQTDRLIANLNSGSEEEPDTPVEPDNPEITLTSISATYTGGNVAVGTALTDLTGITVTATYSDGSTANVTGYTLSGTIAEGSNTITVSYGGKTTTFTVTGVAGSGGETTSPFDGTWVEGVYVAGGKEYTGDAWKDYVTTDYVSTDGYSKVVIENDTNKNFNIVVDFYNAEKTYLSGGGGYVQSPTSANYPSPLVAEIPDGTAYVRISTKNRIGSENAGWVYYTELKYYME